MKAYYSLDWDFLWFSLKRRRFPQGIDHVGKEMYYLSHALNIGERELGRKVDLTTKGN